MQSACVASRSEPRAPWAWACDGTLREPDAGDNRVNAWVALVRVRVVSRLASRGRPAGRRVANGLRSPSARVRAPLVVVPRLPSGLARLGERASGVVDGGAGGDGTLAWTESPCLVLSFYHLPATF